MKWKTKTESSRGEQMKEYVIQRKFWNKPIRAKEKKREKCEEKTYMTYGTLSKNKY